MNNDELRKKRAALSFAEKIRGLEKMRRRSIAIAASGLRSQKPLNAPRPKPKTSPVHEP